MRCKIRNEKYLKSKIEQIANEEFIYKKDLEKFYIQNMHAELSDCVDYKKLENKRLEIENITAYHRFGVKFGKLYVEKQKHEFIVKEIDTIIEEEKQINYKKPNYNKMLKLLTRKKKHYEIKS